MGPMAEMALMELTASKAQVTAMGTVLYRVSIAEVRRDPMGSTAKMERTDKQEVTVMRDSLIKMEMAL
jgi:hypothetical protein